MALTEARRTGEFLISEANGTRSREPITVDAAAASLAAGTVLGKVTATGQYVAYSNVAVDGSEVAAGILYAAVDATAADAPGVIIARDAEVAEVHLTGIDAAAKVDLAALGIIVR